MRGDDQQIMDPYIFIHYLMEISSDEIGRLLVALLIGGVIGIEREFSSKAAGFRTMILICVGSALFTMMSVELGSYGHNEDRLAANILTGIGFIGAGMVFKEGFNVVGLTTAATIWITAALGIAVGAGNYRLAGEGAVLTILVLFLFEFIQTRITNLHQKRSYRIILYKDKVRPNEIEDTLRKIPLRFSKWSETKNADELRLTMDVFGNKNRIHAFNEYLLGSESVKSFDS